jgi:hypothetical protein
MKHQSKLREAVRGCLEGESSQGNKGHHDNDLPANMVMVSQSGRQRETSENNDFHVFE